jgi:hypothetical protein
MISCHFDEEVPCVAIPSRSRSALNWKTPAQCVWDDAEFSQNNIQLKSKIALRPIVEQHIPAARPFFAQILKLPNAGIDELLADLALMQVTSSHNPKRVHLIYERIKSCRRTDPRKIKYVSLQSVWHRLTRWIEMHSKPDHSCFFGASVTKATHGSHLKTASGPDQFCSPNMP